jgi:hypothetical protein
MGGLGWVVGPCLLRVVSRQSSTQSPVRLCVMILLQCYCVHDTVIAEIVRTIRFLLGLCVMSESPWRRRLVLALALLASFNLGLFARPVLDAARRPDAFRVLEGSSRIREAGVSAAPRLLVAFDPYCRHCREVYESLSRHVESGEIQVDWVPIAFMDADSAAVGAEMLSAANPAVALSRWFGAQLGTSPVVPQGARPEAARLRVLANTELIRRLAGRPVAPALFYRDKRGVTQLTIGMPADLDRWLRDMSS